MLMYITQIVHNCLSLNVHFAVYLERKKKRIGYVWAESLDVLLKKKERKKTGGGGGG